MRQDPTGMLDGGVLEEGIPGEPTRPLMVIFGENGETYSIYVPYVEITAERVNKQTDAAVAQPASIADQTANVLPVQTEEDMSRVWVQARLNQMIKTDEGADAVLNSDLPHDYKKDALIYKMHHGEAAQFGLAFMESALIMAQGAMLLRGLGYNTPEIPSFSPGRIVNFADDVVISQTDDVAVKGGSRYTIDPKKYDYFFGRVTTGRRHNIIRSAQNKADLAKMGITNESQLAKVFDDAIGAPEISRHVGEYGTTITRRVGVGNVGSIQVKFFYEGGNMSLTPKITTIIPQIH